MSNLNVQPMQWKPIIDISEVEPLTDDDKELFSEVRDVLKKYKALDKFGLSLIHKHFDIAENECMLECTDIETRTLVIKPIKVSEMDVENTTITQWRLTDGDAVAEAGCRCAMVGGGHGGYHQSF